MISIQQMQRDKDNNKYDVSLKEYPSYLPYIPKVLKSLESLMKIQQQVVIKKEMSEITLK